MELVWAGSLHGEATNGSADETSDKAEEKKESKLLFAEVAELFTPKLQGRNILELMRLS